MTESVDAVTVALIGAGGAVIGGLLTAGSSVLLETQKLRHAKKGDARRAQRELRQAARLASQELTSWQALGAAYGMIGVFLMSVEITTFTPSLESIAMALERLLPLAGDTV